MRAVPRVDATTPVAYTGFDKDCRLTFWCRLKEPLIYSIFRPGTALKDLIYNGSITGFLNKSALP